MAKFASFFEKYSHLYFEAGVLTLRLATIGIIGAIVVGVICGLILNRKIKIISTLVKIYIEISRNTPLIIQLFFLYFGLPRVGIKLESETCAIIGLVFLGGSYMAETFRSGLDAIPKNQEESGISIGLTPLQVFCYVNFPQALAIAMPSLSANVIFLIKETSVFSVVAIADLMYVAKDLIGLYYDTDEALLLLVISYLIILLPISIIFALIERRLRNAGFGSTSFTTWE